MTKLLLESADMSQITSSDKVCLIVFTAILFASSLLAAFSLAVLFVDEKKYASKGINTLMGVKRLSKSEIDRLRKMYPEGSRVMLENIQKTDPDHLLHYGDTGTVDWVDEYGNLYVLWDRTYLRARLIEGTDKFRVLNTEGKGIIKDG